MKYKVGDKVRVRSDLKVGQIYGCDRFVDDMKYFKGKEVTIKKGNGEKYNIKEDNGVWNWTDEMLEPIEETFKVGDVVYAKANGVELKVTETDLYRLETKCGTAWFMKKELLTHIKPLKKITEKELAEMGYELVK